MKHPKRINLAMKKLITANGLNPKDYWFLNKYDRFFSDNS